MGSRPVYILSHYDLPWQHYYLQQLISALTDITTNCMRCRTLFDKDVERTPSSLERLSRKADPTTTTKKKNQKETLKTTIVDANRTKENQTESRIKI